MQVNRVSISMLALVVAFLASSATAQAQNSPRPLAPGVIKRIEIELDAADSHTLPMALPGLQVQDFTPKTMAAETTLYNQASKVILFREFVWEYEFSLIGLRQSKIRVPDANGQLVDKNFWYMVYRIRDTGKTMTFEKVKQNPALDHIKHQLKFGESVKDKIKFVPQFTLSGWVEKSGKYQRVNYSSTINPVALYRIQQKEDPKQVLLDDQQMSEATIPLAKTDSDPGVWGVAIWEDVNPELDFVSVFVKGLSNAYRLNRKDLSKPAKLKTLQLNFWRPGDTFAQKRDAVQYGIPLVDRPGEQVEICRRYALPGPVIKVYEKDKLAERNVLVGEVPAEIDLDSLQSSITPKLDQGVLVPEIVADLARSGVKVDQNARLTTVLEGFKWNFSDNGRDFIVVLDPIVWQPRFGEIQFIKSLDHLWIYR